MADRFIELCWREHLDSTEFEVLKILSTFSKYTPILFAVALYNCYYFTAHNAFRQSQVLQCSVCSNRTSQVETYLLKCLCTHPVPSTVMVRHLVYLKISPQSDRMVPMPALWKGCRTIRETGTHAEAFRDGEI